MAQALALLDEVIGKCGIINQPALTEQGTYGSNGLWCKTALTQAVGELTLAPWAQFEQAQGGLLGLIKGHRCHQTRNGGIIKVLTHEESFVGQHIETNAECKFTVDFERDTLAIAHLCPNGRNDTWRWCRVIPRRRHRRRPPYWLL
jgi:hypothetical protein